MADCETESMAHREDSSVDRLRRWREAALVLNASRRFRYTLDLKKEEEKEKIRTKLSKHAQLIRAALLFKEAQLKTQPPYGDFGIGQDQRTSMTGCPNNFSTFVEHGDANGVSELDEARIDKGSTGLGANYSHPAKRLQQRTRRTLVIAPPDGYAAGGTPDTRPAAAPDNDGGPTNGGGCDASSCGLGATIGGNGATGGFVGGTSSSGDCVADGGGGVAAASGSGSNAGGSDRVGGAGADGGSSGGGGSAGSGFSSRANGGSDDTGCGSRSCSITGGGFGGGTGAGDGSTTSGANVSSVGCTTSAGGGATGDHRGIGDAGANNGRNGGGGSAGTDSSGGANGGSNDFGCGYSICSTAAGGSTGGTGTGGIARCASKAGGGGIGSGITGTIAGGGATGRVVASHAGTSGGGAAAVASGNGIDGGPHTSISVGGFHPKPVRYFQELLQGVLFLLGMGGAGGIGAMQVADTQERISLKILLLGINISFGGCFLSAFVGLIAVVILYLRPLPRLPNLIPPPRPRNCWLNYSQCKEILKISSVVSSIFMVLAIIMVVCFNIGRQF
ncbi:hypothetical protein MKW98_017008 [Papaver atlanticum]|uniref:Calcium-transporting P-type ATPase N-terminal autoinhibitory domain-containing protein n=1 Tax=Papaver atlanticum TaxID=357466 RepID=A0AAD4TH05_9MAGN|nr:hypothetical protein MKW98_017008 [Papaver atlanticum]